MSRDQSFIAKNIKKYREELAVTQDQLAALSNITYNVIIKIESGATKNPTIETVMKIAQGLRVSVDDLLKLPINPGTLICSACKKEYATSKAIWKCTCGGLLNLAMNALFPIDEAR